jgi:hypothetical protein
VRALLAVASMAGLGSCADYSGLLILQNQAPSASCVTAPNIGDPYISHGTALAGAGGGYFLTPLIQSSLVNREATTNGDIVAMRDADVEIQAVDSADSRTVVDALKELKGANRHISGSISPKGLLTTTVPVIDSAQAAAMATKMTPGQAVEVIVRVVVYGDTAGTRVSSQDFYYPITVLNQPNGRFQDLGKCSDLAVGTTGMVKDCFQNGQDGGFTQCCTDDGGRAVCPAVGSKAGP